MKVWVGFLTTCVLRAVIVYAYYFLTLESRKGVNCTNGDTLKQTTLMYLNSSLWEGTFHVFPTKRAL